jgi:uncharacterized OsmC-like protein
MEVQSEEVLNGWNLDAFRETVATVESNPDAGRLTWRGRASWDGHFGVDARAEEIEQLGEVIPRRFTLRGDHPPELLGENTGPTAVETLLAALGSCVAGTYAAHATARGIHVDGLEVSVESAIDLEGFLQLAPAPAGLDGVRITIRVRTDADEDTLEEIRRIVTNASPVYDSIRRPVSIESQVVRLTAGSQALNRKPGARQLGGPSPRRVERRARVGTAPATR